MTDVQGAVGRLLGDGMTEAQIVALLEGLAEAIEDGSRQWELSLHDLSAYTAFAFGGFTAQVMREAERHGYEQAMRGIEAADEAIREGDAALREHLAAAIDVEADLAEVKRRGDELGREMAETFALVDQAVDAVITDDHVEGRLRQTIAQVEALDGWASLPENVRMLITDAALLLDRAAVADVFGVVLKSEVRVWRQHHEAVLAGKFGRYALKTDGSGVDTGDGAA